MTRALAFLGACLLVSCQQGASTLESATPGGQTQLSGTGAGTRALSSTVNGERVGRGPVRVAMLLPNSASGASGRTGQEMANAAKMAMAELGKGRFELVLKDTRGQPAEASVLAAEARDEGSSLVLGPLFSANVSSASAVTQPAKIPMIGFSSDVARARAGVYLLSFAPDADIRRTLSYGYSRGATQTVAILPDNSYGRLAEREMRKTYDQLGAQVVSVVRYSRSEGSIANAAKSSGVAMINANAIYIPEGGAVPALVLNTLRKSGISLQDKQVMGSGQWSNMTRRDQVLNGAIYAGVDRTNFPDFAARYKAKHGNDPSVTAALGYDAIALASELLRRNQRDPFAPNRIENRSGFRGVTGIFRFESNGRLQRALVINRIESGKVVVESPAPTSFVGIGLRRSF